MGALGPLPPEAGRAYHRCSALPGRSPPRMATACTAADGRLRASGAGVGFLACRTAPEEFCGWVELLSPGSRCGPVRAARGVKGERETSQVRWGVGGRTVTTEGGHVLHAPRYTRGRARRKGTHGCSADHHARRRPMTRRPDVAGSSEPARIVGRVPEQHGGSSDAPGPVEEARPGRDEPGERSQRAFEARPRRTRGEPLDEAMLRTLYEQHWQVVLNYAARLLLQDHHGAADVTQEVFLRAWRHAEVFTQGPGYTLSLAADGSQEPDCRPAPRPRCPGARGLRRGAPHRLPPCGTRPRRLGRRVGHRGNRLDTVVPGSPRSAARGVLERAQREGSRGRHRNLCRHREIPNALCSTAPA